YRAEIIRACSSHFLLSLDVLQDGTNSKVLSFSRQAQSLRRRRQVLSRGSHLIGQRLHAGVAFDHLTNDVLAHLFSTQPGGFQPGLSALDPSPIQQAARPDSPAKTDEVIF